MKRRLVGALLALAAGSACAEGLLDSLRDPQDGALDASEWLLEKKGFLPVPILITEPAVGYGAGLSLLFFRESVAEARARSREGHYTPPDIYAAAFGGTENGSTFLGAGGLLTFFEDRWRYRGAVGRPDVNLDFYGAGGTLNGVDRSISYNAEGWISTQQVMRRLGDSNNFLGARWIYLDLDARFDPSRPPPPGLPQAVNIRSSGVGPLFEHDSRDNFFTPSRGWFANLEALFYSPAIGSDEKYQTYRARTFGYAPLGGEFVLGGRIDARTARGEVPFYQLPFIELRGVPAVRYQDESAGAVETELRWNVTPRWALVGYLGAGRAWGSRDSFSNADTVFTRGLGFRYLVARRLGIYMGVDVARGPEDTAFYIQLGSAWR